MARRVLAWTLAALLGGCQIVGGYEPFEEGASAAVAPHACDPLPASKVDALGLVAMLLIKAEDDRCFWIDKTEVTVAQYDQFLSEIAANPQVDNGWDETRCSWKGAPSDPAHQPAEPCAAAAGTLDSTPFAPDRPIRCIDWCDAWRFCKWADKDLCLTGGLGGTVDPMAAADEWGTACSGGKYELPYGNEYEHQKCNVALEPAECFVKMKSKCTATVVGNFQECRSPAGPLNMVGNVAEWSRTCSNYGTGATEDCNTRGGSYADSESIGSCSYRYRFYERQAREPTVGLRCCAPLTPAEQGQLAK